jgi:cytochrome P450
MKTRRFPPGPSGFAAMRGLRRLGSNDLASVPRFFAQLTADYGPVVSWRLLGRPFFFINDAALIDEALVTRGRDYVKGRGIQRLKRLLGRGLLTSEQPLHLRQRRMLQPAFHRERIAGYGTRMVASTVKQSAQWQSGDTLAMDAEMTRLTLAIAADTLFSADVGAQSAQISESLDAAMSTFPASMSTFGALLEKFPMLPINRRFNAARAKLDAVIYGLIAERRRTPSAAHDDLLAMLLETRDDANGAMDDEQIRDEAMTIFLAGHETTANALAWTWYLLARHPAAARTLRAEIDTVLGDRLPTAADLPHLAYTHDVFAETMRLYPPAWIIGRIAARETQLGEWVVPAGSIVICSEYITQRSERYFRDALAFRPERWRDDPAPPKGAYFPFGGGNRRCIGEPFAWMEGVLVIATIAQRFDFEPVGDADVGIEPLVTLRPKSPVRMRVRARDASRFDALRGTPVA